MKQFILFTIFGLIVVASPLLLVELCSFLGHNDCGVLAVFFAITLPAGLLISLVSGIVWFSGRRKTNNKNS